MFYHNSILISSVYLLLFFIALGNAKGNETISRPTDFIKSVWSKSIEAFSYNVKLISVTKCKIPNNKMDPSFPVAVKHTLRRVTRDNTLFDMEFNVAKRVGPLALTSRCYIVKQNSAKDLVYKIEKAECNHYLMTQIQIVMKFKFDKCYLNQGVYKTENINLNFVTELLSKTITSTGIYAYEIEFSHPRGILYCHSYNCQVSERRKSKP